MSSHSIQISKSSLEACPYIYPYIELLHSWVAFSSSMCNFIRLIRSYMHYSPYYNILQMVPTGLLHMENYKFIISWFLYNVTIVILIDKGQYQWSRRSRIVYEQRNTKVHRMWKYACIEPSFIIQLKFCSIHTTQIRNVYRCSV